MRTKIQIIHRALLGLVLLFQLSVAPMAFAENGAAADSEVMTGVIATESNRQTDQEIQQRLEDIYRQVPGLEDITVDVNQGVVTLSGEVADKQAAQQARSLASRMDRVVLLDSQLSLRTDVQFRLETLQSKIKNYLNFAIKILPLVVVAILILIAGFFLARLSGLSKSWLAGILPNPFIAELVVQVIKAGIILVALIIALDIVGAGGAIVSIAGGLGIFGLALGFATRDSIENYIASILLSIKQPFSPLDHVNIAGHEGRVLSLTTRSTILMSFDGNHIRIPNAVVYKATITNFSRNPRRRFSFTVGVATQTKLANARQIALQALHITPGVLVEPEPNVLIDSLGDSSVLLTLQAWVDQGRSDFGKVRGEAIRQLKLAFDEHGIEMPNPQYTIDMRAVDKPMDRTFGRGSEDKPAVSELSSESIEGIDIQDSNLNLQPDKTIERQLRAEQIAQQDDNLLNPEAKQEL